MKPQKYTVSPEGKETISLVALQRLLKRFSLKSQVVSYAKALLKEGIYKVSITKHTFKYGQLYKDEVYNLVNGKLVLVHASTYKVEKPLPPMRKLNPKERLMNARMFFNEADGLTENDFK